MISFSEHEKEQIRSKKINVHNNFSDYFSFNFSFVTHDKKYALNSKVLQKPFEKALLKKIRILSSQNMNLLILNEDKTNKLEQITKMRKKNFSVNKQFRESGRNKECGPGYWVFRPNKHSRVIGKIDGNIFYILCLDPHLTAYSHS